MAHFWGRWVAAIALALATFGASAQLVLYGGLGGQGTAGGSTNDGALVIVSQTDGSTTVVGHPLGVARLSGLAFGLDGTLYGATQGGAGGPPPPSTPGNLIRIDPDTGALLSSVGFTDAGTGVAISMADLAVHPVTGVLYGMRRADVPSGNNGGRLYTINPATGVGTLIGDTGAFFGSIAFAPDGTLYMSWSNMTQTVIRLKTIDPATAGELTSAHSDFFFGALAVRPTDGVIFGSTGESEQIFTISKTGIATLVGPTGSNQVGSLSFRPGSGAANYQGLWWAAPANSESGWGVNLAHQGDKIFVSWFTYDTTGKGWWLVATLDKKGPNTYDGKLYTTRGPAFNAVPWDPNAVVPTEAGMATLTFTDANNGSFHYVIGTVDQTKTITREVFGPMPSCTFAAVTDLTTATNYQDLWWKKPANTESGWGINLNHQGDTIFATWFTYDLDGSPLWLVANAPKQGPGVYSGELYRTSGARFDAFKATDVVPDKVGTATFTVVDGNTVTFDYSVKLAGMANPVMQSRAITREIFTAPGTACK